MANADQIKALLQSHCDGDDRRFYSVAMQVAAQEAKLGHGKLAEEIRSLIDEGKRRKGVGQPIPIGRPRGELANLLSVSYTKSRLTDIVLEDNLKDQIERVIREQRHASEILAHGLSPRRKLLLVGPPGTGKTFSTSILAGELGLPLCQVRLDGLISKFMGETAAKLRQIFDSIEQTRGVYFFDEFDAIGSQRGLANDVGEIRRVLNSFLLMIEQDCSHSLIIAATNHPEILDHALFRRFDDVLYYSLPDIRKIDILLKRKLANFSNKRISWKKLSNEAIGLSHSDIARACEESIKHILIKKEKVIHQADVSRMLAERQMATARLQGKNNGRNF